MKIYQIYYNKESKDKLFPSFTPYNNSNPDKPGEFEYGVMRKVYKNHNWSKDPYLGVFSWKFFDKLDQMYTAKCANGKTVRVNRKVLIAQLKQRVDEGYDVMHMNPFPWEGPNMWIQGEYHHPGLLKKTYEVLKKAGIPWQICHQTHEHQTLCYCNYWVANKNFWDVYMHFTEIIYNAYYKVGVDEYFPYIMERL